MEINNDWKVIKRIVKRHFDIAIVQVQNGNFVVLSETDYESIQSVPFEDLNSAKAVFEDQLIALEGH